MANTLGGIALPRLTSEDVTPAPIGQRRRSIDGTLHADFVASKRSWRIECRYLTSSQYAALDQVRRNALGGAVALHLDSVGADVFVMLSDWHGERVQFGGPSGWESQGRNLTFTAEEV